MATILVSGASGVVGYGVLKSLRADGEKHTLIGTTIYNDSVAAAFCDIFEQAVSTNDEGYTDWLVGVIKKHEVDMVIPGIEADMLKWNEERRQISDAGAFPLLNNPDLVALCSDKWEFYDRLSKTDSDLLIDTRLEGDFETLQNDFGLPFLLKPRRGFASKGIVMVESEEIFNAHKARLGSELMAQPIVGNKEEEFTASGFFDSDSKLLCHIQLKRKLATEGYTEKAEVVNEPSIEAAMEKLATELKPVGPTNFQFRIENGQPKLLEINPRISSATSIRTSFGYNESAMSVEYFLHKKSPAQPEIKKGYAVRYIEDHIFYDSNNL